MLYNTIVLCIYVQVLPFYFGGSAKISTIMVRIGNRSSAASKNVAKQCAVAAAASVVALGCVQGSEAFVVGGGVTAATGCSSAFMGVGAGVNTVRGVGTTRIGGGAVKRSSPTMVASVKVKNSGKRTHVNGCRADVKKYWA